MPDPSVGGAQPPRAAEAEADAVTIRRAGPADGPALGDVWLASWRATFDFPPAHPDGRVVALMALSETMVDQLYVAPDRIGLGIGRRLVDLAKDRRPGGLDLFCFAVNVRARAFYERHGFVVVATGDGSENAEGQPDIRYAWRPGT